VNIFINFTEIPYEESSIFIFQLQPFKYTSYRAPNRMDVDWYDRIGKHLEDEWELFESNIPAFNKMKEA